MQTKALKKGLNYIVWKLDEKSTSLQGAWKDDFSRDIPVLPGTYTIVFTYGSFQDSTKINVLPDPRFDLEQHTDEKLYAFRKALDMQVAQLTNSLKAIDTKKKLVENLANEVEKSPSKAINDVAKKVKSMVSELERLRAQGQSPKPKRQVGAWQSFETTPYSKIQQALGIAAAQTKRMSPQQQEVLDEATEMVSEFSKIVAEFMDTRWMPFKNTVENSGLRLQG